MARAQARCLRRRDCRRGGRDSDGSDGVRPQPVLVFCRAPHHRRVRRAHDCRGGGIVARILAEAALPLPTLYGVDLVAAALGALAPLVLLGPLSSPSALLVLASLLALTGARVGRGGAGSVKWTGVGVAALALAVVLVSETTSAGLVLMYPKGRRRGAERPVYEAWNADLTSKCAPLVLLPARSVLWAASPRTPEGTYSAAYGLIDGDAGTFVHAYKNVSSLDVLRYDATSVIHCLRPEGGDCLRDWGRWREGFPGPARCGARSRPRGRNQSCDCEHAAVSGRDIASPAGPARRGASRRRPNGACKARHLLSHPPGDARGHLGRHERRGVRAHGGDRLHPRGVGNPPLRRVEPDGIIGFSRWYDAPHIEETARLVSLAVASLLARGVARPRIISHSSRPGILPPSWFTPPPSRGPISRLLMPSIATSNSR